MPVVLFFFVLKVFPFLEKKACIVIASKQDKCLQMVEVHMQFWFGQNLLILPVMQNLLLFHCSFLMAVESNQQNPA